MQHHGAMTTQLGARHPITKPTTRVTNNSTWPDHMTGLVGWWRRVERDGVNEGMRLGSKPGGTWNLSPGGTWKLRGRREILTHRRTATLESASENINVENEKERPPLNFTPTRQQRN